MTAASVIKTNFTSGEVSPRLYGRGDLRAYINGCRELKNVYIQPTGGVIRRSGLRLVDNVNKEGRLVSFEFNTDQVYLLFFSDYLMEVYTDEVKTASVETPWSLEQLKTINWTQSADTLMVVHPDVPPRKITRTSNADWSIEEWSFYEEDGFLCQPYNRFIKTDATLTPSSTTGAITLTCSEDFFDNDYVGLRLRLNDGEVKINSISSANEASATVTNALSSTSADKTWEEPSFSSIRGYPVSVTYHQDRLVVGGSRDLPNRLWLSKSSDLMNFDLGEGLDDEAIEFSILSDQVNAIKTVFSGRHLQVFTTGAEWMVTGDPLTPSVIQLKRQTRVGSLKNRNIPPQDIDGATVFISSNGKELREFVFADVEDAYQSNDLAVLSEHILKNPLDMDYDKNRRLLFIAMENGKIACVTNYRSEEVTGWSKLETAGEFISVCVVYDKTYVLVKRNESYFIEVFDDDLYTDSSLTGSSLSPKEVWTGLEHLEGNTVKIIGDGAVLEEQEVIDGKINLPFAVSNIAVGLSYEHVVSSLPVAIGTSAGADYPQRVRLIEASFKIVDTSLFEVDLGGGVKNIPLKKLGLSGVLDAVPENFTGDLNLKAFGWIDNMQKPLWKVKSDAPLSLTILSVSTKIKTGD